MSSPPPQQSSLTQSFSFKFGPYLPLSEESSLSTRGQVLPSLLSTSLARRLSTATKNDPDEHEASRGQAGGGSDDESLRRMSAAQVLHTPQMRSQRLIGNSNPRYKWCVMTTLSGVKDCVRGE